MTRLPFQVLVYIRRRRTSENTEYLLLKRTPARGGFWQGVSGGVEVISEECFGAEVSLEEGEPQLDPTEHEDYRWLDLSQALALLYWPENQEALSRFADMIP